MHRAWHLDLVRSLKDNEEITPAYRNQHGREYDIDPKLTDMLA